MELPGNRKRGRSKRMFMDVVKEDMAEFEVTEECREDRNKWRWISSLTLSNDLPLRLPLFLLICISIPSQSTSFIGDCSLS